MHRFFLESEDRISSNEVILNNEESVTHLIKVLRAKNGESIELISETDLIIAKINVMNTNSVSLIIESIQTLSNESAVQVDLFQCLPKGPKLELILQKNVELGIHDFYLVQSKRCIVDYKPKDVPKKLERLERVIKEAAKQSKRERIPSLHGIMKISEIEEVITSYDAFFILYEKEKNASLKQHMQTFTGKRIAILVGPEGGFEASEVERIVMAGAKSVTLGSRILRTETAGFVATTCIQYEIGELD
ncbi:MAG: hypothetical protein BGO41_13080 [Clostridiales bacterium 38-18]|nr:MAG: hypothetical protein BGO41_13080 [Clostridiales bacterium 38-18]